MDRRESMKSMLLGTLAGGLVIGCQPEDKTATVIPDSDDSNYGRTDEEKALDKALMDEQFFTEGELGTIAILCDLILPASENFGSASEAEVPAFIEFIAKDISSYKTPLRGGLMWLNSRANKKFEKLFADCSEAQQKQLLDEIAYPDDAAPEVAQGVSFFSLMRNLTLTGYYTTKMGLDDLGYQGNRPGIWDGVPEDVLKEHGMEYEQEWLAKCVNQETRDVMAEWDNDGNLIT